MSGEFTLAIGQFIKTCDMKAASVIQGVVQTLGQDAVMATPRETGLLRGAWQIGINQIPTASPMRIDPGGLSTLQSINSDSLAIKAGDIVYVVNNTVYANMVEFGGWRPPAFTPGVAHSYKKGDPPRVRTTGEGFSLQAPAGMARIAVSRLQAEFDSRVAVWTAKGGA